MRRARRYRVHGRVQGVGFRFFTRESARRENVNGWVQNLPDGSVEVLAEGEAASLDRFEQRLREGPRGARVDHLDSDEELTTGHEAGFEIR
jgi:acylphosphatase